MCFGKAQDPFYRSVYVCVLPHITLHRRNRKETLEALKTNHPDNVDRQGS
jgi:hypothetical protein